MWKVVSSIADSFVLAFTSFLFGKYIINKKCSFSKEKIFLTYLILAIIHVLILLLNISIISKIFFVVIFFTTFKYVYELSIKDTILSVLLYYIMLLCGEVIYVLFGTLILKLTGNQFYIIFGQAFVSNIMVSLFCLLFSKIFKNLINKILNINIKNKTLLYWIIIYIIVFIFFVFAFANKTYKFQTYVVLVMTFIILIIIFVSFLQKIKNNELESKYDKLLEFIKKYEIEIDKQRTMRHETKNQLLIIKSKLIDKDNESSVISYIEEIIKDNNKQINHSEYAKLRYLPSNGLKGLFYFKVDEAICDGIKVDINVSKEIENSFLYDLNSNLFNQLGKVLGILLDNAIEAAKESDDKIIGIEIYLNNGCVNFIISNSYLSVNDNLKSTKGINRGHGLLLVKAIINSNNKFRNEKEVTDKLFIQKIKLKK